MSTATTPGRTRPSALPTPGRQISNSGIPTPGRPRSSASGHMGADSNGLFSSTSTTADEMKALSDAIRANDPSTYRAGSSGLASPALSDSVFGFNGGATIVPRKSLSSRPSLGRPTSRASTSTEPNGYSNGFRSKTPTLPAARFAPRSSTASTASSYVSYDRPESQQSEVHSLSRLGHNAADRERMQRGQWEVGDPVRMENLGMEGTLRFLGEIAGKAGTWAGVELLPGFAGKGKNDGSVAGVHYFTCAPQCGVFVMPSKLSLSTVAFPPRAPSVASSRASASVASGRITPSGRVTPSSGRGRAAPVTPVARKSISSAKTPVPAMPTPGSRASKYVGMTAKQLTSAKGLSESPTRPNLSATTPRAPKLNGLTPARARISVGTATPSKKLPAFAVPGTTPSHPTMPPPRDPVSPTRRPLMPPSSPIRQTRDKLLTPTLSQTSTDTYVDGETQRSDSRNGFDMKSFEAKNRAIQDQISRLMDGKKSPSSPAAVSSPTMATSSSFPGSGSSTTVQLLQLQMERLKSQVESLEKENSLLQSAVASQPTVEQTDNTALQNELSDALKQVQVVKEERDTALSQLSTARNETASAQRIVEDKQAKIDSLSQSNSSLTTQVNGLQDSAREAETKVKDLTAIVDEKESLIKTLKEAVEAKAGKEDEAAAAIKAKDVEIGLLESRIKRAAADFEDERKDLFNQVDELRTAGQETIALYEERIAQYEDRRYVMEDMIQDLETKLQRYVERPPSPATLARHANAATQIENETLKEQVNHLQHKLSTLEDQLEDMRMMSEKDEQAVNSRITRFRETESTLRAELETLRKEGEQLVKAESAARLKVAEVEEAFRENDAALENARAEIETLRTELSNLEGTQDDAESTAAERVAEAAKKASDEKLKFVEEIDGLKVAVDRARAEQKEALDEAEIATNRLVIVNKTADELRARINALEADRSDLEKTLQEEAAKLQLERNRVQELQLILDSKHAEPEPSRASPGGSFKELGLRDPRRDSANSISSRTSSRSTNMNSEENLKDQVKGLKHINAELRKENSGLSSQIKVLESEIKMHLAEIEDLRETTKSLEKTLEEVIDKEEKALAGEDSDKSASKDSEEDPVAVIKSLKTEVEQLQKKLSDVEKEHTKAVHSVRRYSTTTRRAEPLTRSTSQLNKDILDLEQLVEAKIYREDDLEREIERLNEKISRRRSRKVSGDSLRHSIEPPRPPSQGSMVSAVVPPEAEGDDHPCELCGQHGHDLASCDIVGFSAAEHAAELAATTTTTSTASAAEPEAADDQDHWCENCEVLGDHVTEDCPYGDDVF
ncbi:hypothetical protein FRC04_004311 [Tulasnella sp. 424]|nr:hypothetical protein FRC04_004311 [Tulasnella sp. 424]